MKNIGNIDSVKKRSPELRREVTPFSILKEATSAKSPKGRQSTDKGNILVKSFSLSDIVSVFDLLTEGDKNSFARILEVTAEKFIYERKGLISRLFVAGDQTGKNEFYILLKDNDLET